MKRAVRVLVWLYPSSWRKRYGAEFRALLEDATPSAYDALDLVLGALKMRMKTGIHAKVVLAGLAVATVMTTVVSLKNHVFSPHAHDSTTLYASSATFAVSPSYQITAQVFDPSRRDVFFSREFLTSLIQQHNLYPSERGRMPMDAVVDKMKRDIRISLPPDLWPGKHEARLVLEFEYSDPKIAREVNEELLSQFLKVIVDSALVDPHPGTTFRILDPPTLPLKPVEPNLARS